VFVLQHSVYHHRGGYPGGILTQLFAESETLFTYTKEPDSTNMTQAEGRLMGSNLAFYFRYRGSDIPEDGGPRRGKASLVISRTSEPVCSPERDEALAYFELPICTGWQMPPEQVTELVVGWIKEFNGQGQG